MTWPAASHAPAHRRSRRHRDRRPAAARAIAAAAVESLEPRRLLSATAVELLDAAGPIDQLTAAGDRIYFTSRPGVGEDPDRLWVSRGTASSTDLLVDFDGTGIDNVSHITPGAGNMLYFTATADGGRQVFRTDTSSPGGYTQLTSVSGAQYDNLANVDGRIYFSDPIEDKLWFVDNAAGSATFVGDFDATSTFSAANGLLFYLTSDNRLFRSDGTGAGTYELGASLDSVRQLMPHGDVLYFDATAGTRTHLYRTTGTVAGTTKVADSFELGLATPVVYGSYVYFSGGYYPDVAGSVGEEVYRITQTGSAPQLVLDANTGAASSLPSGLAQAGGMMYFTARDGDTLAGGVADREVFRYNVTDGSTAQVTEGTVYAQGRGVGVLNTYAFLAHPTKTDPLGQESRLYVTDWTTDDEAQVGNLPVSNDSGGDPYTKVVELAAAAGGVFLAPQTGFGGSLDTTLMFAETPFSTLDGGVLSVTGTAGHDRLAISVDAGELVLSLNSVEERQLLSSVSRMNVYLGDGHDVLNATQDVTTRTYVLGGYGDDTINSGAGNDTITAGAGRNRVSGGDGDDRLNGSGGRDFLRGNNGNDRIYGMGGYDDLSGQTGVDRLWGGSGNDALKGDGSNDRLYGGSGDDWLSGGTGDNFLYGEDGNDVLRGDDGRDVLDGGNGNDSINGYAGIDTLFGGAGDDMLWSRDAELDTVDGGADFDRISRDDEEQSVINVEDLL